MKVTAKQLKKIIMEACHLRALNEETTLLVEYEQYIWKDESGDLWVTDDEGNKEKVSYQSDLYDSYDYLQPGYEYGETILGTSRGRSRGRGGWGGYRRRRRRW
jgi:hypothetical protein